MDCSRAILDQPLKKDVIPLKIVAVFEPSEKGCWSSEKSCHFSEKNIVRKESAEQLAAEKQRTAIECGGP